MRQQRANRPGVIPAALLLLLVIPAALVQSAAPPSPAPQTPEQVLDLSWYTFDGGGYLFSRSDTFTLSATIGQPDAMTAMHGGNLGLSSGFWARALNAFRNYMPIVSRIQPAAPDLIVESITATENGVSIVLRNQGQVTVTDRFWVDLYVNPNPVPTHVNQPWQYLCTEGLVWGVREPGIPLPPSSTLTLATGDFFFWPELSHVEWPLDIGAAVYVQVDSNDALTNYGAVLEIHEMLGGAYNNIRGPVYVQPGGEAAPPGGGSPYPLDAMPPRR